MRLSSDSLINLIDYLHCPRYSFHYSYHAAYPERLVEREGHINGIISTNQSIHIM